MRLLILNWRDISHPKAGGAELVTLRIAERLANDGWSVEWFSSTYPGASSSEERDGIRYVRCGSQATVHMAAFARYRRSRAFDVVVDQINTIPFYAPFYMGTPTVAFFHQLAREVWRYEKGALLGTAGSLAERFYIKLYRNVPIITVSQSSADSLRQYGLQGPIGLIDECVDEAPDDDVPMKTLPRDIVVLGRIVRSKRVEHSIYAARHLADLGWNGRLLIVGGGEEQYVQQIRRLGTSVLGNQVEFLGRVCAEERTQVLRAASCLWMTSVREGWGLAVTEAARHGTPAVVYRVAGLVDSVHDGVTGFVVDPSPGSLADATLRLFSNDWLQFAASALQMSRRLNWDRTAAQFKALLLDNIGR